MLTEAVDISLVIETELGHVLMGVSTSVPGSMASQSGCGVLVVREMSEAACEKC